MILAKGGVHFCFELIRYHFRYLVLHIMRHEFIHAKKLGVMLIATEVYDIHVDIDHNEGIL